MSIIYSYPTTQPTVDDLLIGTDVGDDNATKSFTVQSLVSLINAAAGSGTVTSVQIATDAFLTATGGPITDAGTVTMGLTATGTPSATTFLRGDNQWVVPTVSAGIGVFNNSNTVTTDVSSFNFTGAGVTLSSDAQGNVILNIPGATNAVESIIAGNGISLSDTTGDVVVTNTGVTGLVNGGGISILQDSNGLATLSVTGQAQGTVTSVTAGSGLSLLSGTTVLNPQIGLDYTGADTYITQPAVAVPLAADLIPFHSVAGNTVNKVAFGDIQASTLALVNTSITAANADAITNTYDKSQQGAAPNDRTIGAPPATQIVTCSAAEYTDMANAGELVSNFIYLTTAAAVTPNTVNFTVTDGITNTGACAYNINTTLNGSAFGGSNSSVTGAPGTSYTLQSTVSGFGTCSFSANTVQTINGTIPTTPSPASVTQTVSGTLTAPAAPGTSTASLASIDSTTYWNPGAASTPGDYTITSNTQSGTNGNTYQGTGFNLSASVSNAAEWNLTGLSSSYSPSSGTFGSSNNVVGTLFGSIVKRNYPVAWNITGSYGSYILNQDYSVALSSNIPGASNTISGSGSIDYNANTNAAYMTVSVTTRAGLSFTSGATMYAESAVTGSGVTLTIPLTGSISAGAGTVAMTVGSNTISGGTENTDYTMSYTYAIDGGTPGAYNLGFPQPVNVGSNIVFSATATRIGSKTINCGTSAVVGTGNLTMPSAGGAQTLTIGISGAIGTNRFPISIANIGGGAPGTAYSACNQATIIGYTTSDLSSTGLSVGDVVYANECGTASGFFKPASASAWYRASVSPNSANGAVTFGSGGAVASTGLC